MAWNEPGNSGRDPWAGSGKKPVGGGLPNLDQLVKRLRATFGKRGSAGGSKSLIGAAVALTAALWLLSGFFAIDEKDRGVVQRFGAFSRVAGAGLHWHLPWPVERVERIDVAQIHQAREHATVLTKDINLVDIEMQIQYNIADVKEYFLNLGDPDVTLQDAADSAVLTVAGTMDADTLLGDEHQSFATQVQSILQKTLGDYHSGLSVTDVNVQKVEPPDAVKAAFADAIKAHDDRDRVRSQAHTDADVRLPNARADAVQTVAEATAYRDQAIARAEGDVARFEAVLEQYKKAPKVTRERLYIDTMSEIYSKTTKVMIDVDKGNPVIYLPLDQIVRNSQKPVDSSDASGPQSSLPGSHSTSPGSGGNSQSAPGTSPGSNSGNGDAGRSRDRGSR